MKEDNYGSKYAESLQEFKDEGYTPIKISNVLSFFRMKGKTTNMVRENLEPIPDLKYCVYAKSEKRYYFRTYHGYTLDEIFFVQTDDRGCISLRNHVTDGTVHILMTQEQVEDTKEMLRRVYRSHFRGGTTLDYITWLKLLEEYLGLEDYKDKCRNANGYNTVVKLFEGRIKELWDKSFKANTDESK